MRQIFRSIIAAVAILAMPAAAQAEAFRCESRSGASPYPDAATVTHDHRRYAPASTGETEREFTAFVAAFDGPDDDNGDGRPDLTGNPSWVAYHLIGVEPDDQGRFAEPDVSIRRPSVWYRSSDLAHHWTERPWISSTRIDDSYAGVGRIWNRGHLAMADHAQRISAQASCNTHAFWNASPQAADFNQGPWLHLETYTAALSNMDGEVWIVAGPIFDNAPLLNIAEPDEVPVAVPHAFFKLIVREAGGTVDVRALIFEHPSEGPHGAVNPEPSSARQWVNCSRAQRAGHVYRPAQHLVSLAELESRSGLHFLRGLSDYPRLANVRPSALWDVPEQYWTGYICGGQRNAGPPAEPSFETPFSSP